MINANMREYGYFLYDDENAYGQRALKKDADGAPALQGKVKMSITHISTAIADSIKYKEASYIGLTMDNDISDAYVIQYGDEKLKVLYVVSAGRYKQVFLNEQ